MAVLSIQSLSKRYRDNVVIDHLNLEIRQGEVFGLLGPNGSGKTTTIGMIFGLVRPDSGTISFFGKRRLSALQKLQISGTLEQPNFYPYLTGLENLAIVAGIKRQSPARVLEVLREVGLEGATSRLFSKYSLGMKQRLSIAAALMNDPGLLILDEPTNGLDPEGIIEMRDLLKSLSGRGKTILLTSHILTEIEKICTHVGFLKRGAIVQQKAIGEFGNDGRVFRLKANDLEQLKSGLGPYEQSKVLEERGDLLVIELNDGRPDLLNGYLCSKGIHLTELAPQQKSLEGTFLNVFQQ